MQVQWMSPTLRNPARLRRQEETQVQTQAQYQRGVRIR
jgi:hypothetical protein